MELTVTEVFTAPKVRAVPGSALACEWLGRGKPSTGVQTRNFFLTESEQTQTNYRVLDVFKNENSDLYSQACFSVSGFT